MRKGLLLSVIMFSLVGLVAGQELDRLLENWVVNELSACSHHSLNAYPNLSSPELRPPLEHPNGWWYPAGSSNYCGYLGWLGFNANFGGYHLAQDMCNPLGDPVYAIDIGDVIYSSTCVGGYGGPDGSTCGGALVIQHRAKDGTWFTALYGHLNGPIGVNSHVFSGDQVIGFSNNWNPPHVHFGIRPGYNPPISDGNYYRGYTSNTNVQYGFVNPNTFLSNNSACKNGSSVGFRPNNGPPEHPNGTFIKSASNQTIYLLQNGQKRAISDVTYLRNLYPNGGYDFNHVVTVAQDELTRYPTGSVISSTLPSNGRTHSDGRLIRRSTNGEVSIVTDTGMRRAFISQSVFENLGYLWCNVVDATDSNYDSYPVGAPVTGLPSGTSPPAPTANSATNITCNSFTANWSSSGGATGYRLDVATDVNFTNFVPGYNNRDVGNATSWNVTGLNPQTNYHYRLRAYNSSGTSGNSNTRSLGTSICAPSAPNANPATNVTSTVFSANWSSSAGATGYRLDVATNSNFTTFVPGYNNLDVGNTTIRGVIGLSPGTNYYYRVRAYNAGGMSGNSNTIPVTTTSANIPVTIQTNPAGRSFTVDGTTYSSGQTFNWVPGSNHTISTTSPQGNSSTRYVWNSWSDGGGISHDVNPSSSTTYTANFTTQHFLTMSAGAGGTVTPGSGWHNAGSSVQIAATPNSGFNFSGWTGTGSGSYTGTNNPASVTMNGPVSETAAFSAAPSCSYSVVPTSRNISSNGGAFDFNVNAPSGCAWTAVVGSSLLDDLVTKNFEPLSLLEAVELTTSPSSTFPGSGTGPIPEPTVSGCGNDSTPRDVHFNVTGLSGSVSSVRVDTNFTHSWVGDVTATLIAPNGASHVLFGRTGATTATACGNSSDLGGTYNFFDSATGPNWWTEASTSSPLTPGDYKTTQVGGGGQTNPAPTTMIDAAFSSVSNPNGIWILRVVDSAMEDTGSINSASLTLTAGGTPSDWVTITSGGSGSGNGTVNYSVQQNSNSSSRSKTINVLANNQVQATHTVNQSGAGPSTISVSVQTIPSGRSFTVDGTTYSSGQTFNWVPGSNHTISTTSPQGNGSTRYVWNSWSDGGGISHDVNPSSSTTYTANFTTQHFLTMSAGAGGTVTPGSGWHNAGSSVQIAATPNSGFGFSGWTGTGSGSYTGTNNPASVTMNGPVSETAAFSAAPSCSYSVVPTSRNISSNGGAFDFNVNAPSGCAWTAVVGSSLFDDIFAKYSQPLSFFNLGERSARLSSTFPGSGTGSIPDPTGTGCGNAGTPRDVTFNVTGLSGSVSEVRVDTNFTHTWVGDLTATLIAPNGASHVLFSSTGSTTANGCGDSSDLGGAYAFYDSASGPNWWSEASARGATEPMTPGNYKSTEAGGNGQTNPAPTTVINTAFSSVTNPNGIWILRISDGGVGDTGSISSASLTLTAGGTPSDWVTITSGGSGSGNGTVNYSVQQNSNSSSRSKTINVLANNQVRASHTVNQSGSAPSTIPVSVQTIPSGRSFTVDGTTYSSGQTFNWVPGSNHTISTTSPQGNGSTRYVWNSWSDGGGISHDVNPSSSTTYTANFTTQHFLTMSAGAGGTVTPGSGWHNAGSSVQIAATPNSGFSFSGWTGTGSGSYTGTNNPASVTMNGPVSETAEFTNFGRRAVADFDGDGKTDASIFRPIPSALSSDDAPEGSTSQWWILRSSDLSPLGITFGTPNDELTPADFTGDGKADAAFFRPSTGEWYVLRSEDFTYYAFPWGTGGDIPTPGDFDGDGTADPAVFRPSEGNWYILRSSDSGVSAFPFGADGDRTIVADYDGDGKDDAAIWRINTQEFWILKSTGGVSAYRLAHPSERLFNYPIVGDFTGDGKADVAYIDTRDRSWHILRSDDLSYYSFIWGASGDSVVPGDYDGDGITDPAVWRGSESGTWFILGSSSGFQAIPFGADGDIPVPRR